MTASASNPLTLVATPADQHIAKLAALAIALALVDASLPSPLPGVKPGLANIITLLTLHRLGWQAAVWVTGLRIVGASLLFGTLFSPTFFLSISGGIASLGMLLLVYRLPTRWFGPISHSLLAAFAHFAGQLCLARLWLLPSDNILYFLPAFALAACITGVVNGGITAYLLELTHAPD